MTKYEPLNVAKDHGGNASANVYPEHPVAAGGSRWKWKGRGRGNVRMQRVRILCSGCREKVAKHKSEQHEAHNKQIIERLERTKPAFRPSPHHPQLPVLVLELWQGKHPVV